MVKARIGDVLCWATKTPGFPFGHSGITWFGDNGQWSVEAVNGTLSMRDLWKLDPAPATVHQCGDSLFAAEAASVAHVWSLRKRDPHDSRQGGLTGGTAKFGKFFAKAPEYGTVAAITSALVAPKFGRNARKRAQVYRDHHRSIEGPPTFYGGDFKSHLFCSMFVVAAFQGASAGEQELLKYMYLDALHTTPSELNSYLTKSSNWSTCSWDDYGD